MTSIEVTLKSEAIYTSALPSPSHAGPEPAPREIIHLPPSEAPPAKEGENGRT